MKTRVRILGESNGITRVTPISGACAGDDQFIDGVGHGKPGEIIDVPEFWVEALNDGFELGRKYYGE